MCMCVCKEEMSQNLLLFQTPVVIKSRAVPLSGHPPIPTPSSFLVCSHSPQFSASCLDFSFSKDAGRVPFIFFFHKFVNEAPRFPS